MTNNMKGTRVASGVVMMGEIMKNSMKGIHCMRVASRWGHNEEQHEGQPSHMSDASGIQKGVLKGILGT